MSDQQLLASYINKLIKKDRTSNDTRLLNAFIEKKIVSDDQKHTILKSIVDQLESADEEKKVDVIVNYKGTLTRLIESGVKDDSIHAMYERTYFLLRMIYRNHYLAVRQPANGARILYHNHDYGDSASIT